MNTQPTTSIPDDLLRPGQVAKLLNVHMATVYRMILDGRLPSYRLGGKQRRISRRDVEALLQPERRTREDKPKLTPAWERAFRRRRTEETLRRLKIIDY